MRPAILAVIVLISAASGAQAVKQSINKPGSGMNGARCEAAWLTVSPNGVTISKDGLAPYMADADFTVLDPDRRVYGWLPGRFDKNCQLTGSLAVADPRSRSRFTWA